MAQILSTARLALREIEASDAPFVFELLGSQPFIDNIGDRKVRDLDDARRYIENNIRSSYSRHGFGMWLIAERNSGLALGMSGVLKRDHLEHPDVGYALLPAAFGQGYATEAAGACLAHGRSVLGLDTLCAIVAPHNKASIHVLEKIGLRFSRLIPGNSPGETLQLFVTPPHPAT